MIKIAISTTALLFAVATVNAQTIPNPGFESWSNPNGYNVPDGWGNLNGKTSSASVYTCIKGTPGNPGTSYLKLISGLLFFSRRQNYIALISVGQVLPIYIYSGLNLSRKFFH